MYHLTRKLTLWLVLAAHLVAFECGPSLHRWQCASNGCANTISDCGPCCSASDGCDASQAELASRPMDDSKSGPIRHDSQHCSICKFFAYSPAATFVPIAMVGVEAGHQFPLSYSPLIFQAIPADHPARGPPVWS